MQSEISEIANRIRELREVCDYSTAQLAKELGISEETYIGYETVAYKEEVPSWQKHDSAAETAKEMEFVLQELNGAYILRSAKNISTEGTL